jgi:hypothetical protein
MVYLNSLIEKLRQLEVIMEGCSDTEVDEIEKVAKKSLPLCYVEFLKTMGKDMDRKEYSTRGYLVGNAVFYEDLFDNKEGAIELLQEDGAALALTDDDFVFYDSQGILFAFFKLSEGDNPPVYFCKEGGGQTSFIKTADTLSAFYERYLEGNANLFKV